MPRPRTGYLTVLVRPTTAADWTPTGRGGQIEANAQPDGTRGEVLLMHDGGGDRQQTVEALRPVCCRSSRPTATR